MSTVRIAALTSLLALAGCSSTSTPELSSFNLQTWEMSREHYNSADFEQPSFRLENKDSKFTISGNNGCNNFFGTARVEGNQLIVEQPIGVTRRLCSPDANKIEQEFMSQLDKPMTYNEGDWVLNNGVKMLKINK